MAQAAPQPELVMVDVAQGTLRGRKVFSKEGIPYYSFLGIPYAKPPIDYLRFKDPVPAEEWTGVRDALQHGPICIQHGFIAGSEDCLYLNVFTTKLPVDGDGDGDGVAAPLKPVMVHIHCCMYVAGSGNIQVCGPDYLVVEDVVLVTINYRLGVLGFLCVDDPEAPGNVGLKDQVVALRWIQKNIAAFGGAPSNVTLFGCGSGGASAHMHMLSPMSRGLFTRVIAQSGVAFSPWGWQHHPRESAFRLGEALGFDVNGSTYLVGILRSIDVQELVIAATVHGLSERDNRRLLAYAFVPSMEVNLKGVERFLPGNPLELMQAGLYHNVPYMTGITSHEGMLVLKFLEFIEWESLDTLGLNLATIILPDLRIAEDCPTINEVCTRLKYFYMGDSATNEQILKGIVNMCTDVLFAEGVHVTLKKMAEDSRAPLYFYCFSYDGELNIAKRALNLDYQGACHSDDVGYLFRDMDNDPDLDLESPDAITRARMVKMWTNFAKTGNPTPEGTPLLPVRWPQHTVANPCFLNIGQELRVGQNLNEDRMEFLENLYREHGVPGQDE